MLATALSSAVIGIDAYIVQVEIDVPDGLPAFNTLGLSDSAVKESRERVTAAIKNSDFYFPTRRITEVIQQHSEYMIDLVDVKNTSSGRSKSPLQVGTT